MSLSATKPQVLADQGESIGAHLRRARKARSLKQIEVARIMGVCQHSVVDWETETKKPTDRQYPAIIAFLAYEPWAEPRTLPEQLIAARRRRGISGKAAAHLVGVDEGTYRRWEAGRTTPQDGHRPFILSFLTDKPR